MAFDGITVAALVNEFNTLFDNARIYKINQPENDELILTVKSNKTQYKLLLSANASLPLAYITNETKVNPMTAPNFCMLLRKHLTNARIISITQPSLERIIDFNLEHLNEMGDVCHKHLIIELMGKHSNIIFTDDNNIIIDSIKRINSFVSSVREVLPNKPYFIPNTGEKLDPFTAGYDSFLKTVREKPMPLFKAIYTSFTGISPLIANEVCERAGLSSDTDTSVIDNDIMLHVYNIFMRIINDVKSNYFNFSIIYDNDSPIEFAPFKLSIYKSYEHKDYESVSSLIGDYYMQKSNKSRIKQKSNDIRKLINNSIERASKKYDFMLKQLEDTKKKEKYKIYGELINTYGYNVEPGSKSFKALNYYTNEEIIIPLDPLLSPIDNGKRYFERYNKLKRTFDAVTIQAEETYSKLQHLESISNALDIAESESDINDIKKELIEYGYMKKKAVSKNDKKGKKNAKSNQPLSKPLHYLSSDGFHMYVGKNNYQNDELTFKFASGNDWWFHAKGYAGSHVIVKTNGEELPDRTFEEAGMLAAFYSKEKDLEKAEVDYTLKKNIKKPNNAKPGFVVYYTNYSLIVKPDISNIQLIND